MSGRTARRARDSPRHVVVVGDTLLDRDITGTVDRVTPDAPAPVVDVGAVLDRPGGAGLAAASLALSRAPGRLRVTLVTGLGDDPAGRRVRELVHGLVDVVTLPVAGPTPTKARVRVAGQSLLRLDDPDSILVTGFATAGAASGGTPVAGSVPQARAAGLATLDTAELSDLLGAADAVLVADYGGTLTGDAGVRDALARVVSRVPVVWDPHPRGNAPVPGCMVVTPNRAEAARAAGAPDEHPADLASRLLGQWQARAVAVTDGANGITTAMGEGPPLVVAAAALGGQVDTCGAGDRFAGAVAAALAEGAVVSHAVTAAVAEATEWLAAGGAVATAHALAGHPDAEQVPAGAVHDRIGMTRARGGTVVATGGCFDVLHAGHVTLLEQAAAMGDLLVVLLNSDDSVRRLKGPGRPSAPAADRERVLRALACVDEVVVFDDDEPSRTLADLRPDLWVKGGDYTVEAMPETPVVEAAGGRVVLVPYVPGRSTTAILTGQGVRP